jgi:diaminopimelate epimerase
MGALRFAKYEGLGNDFLVVDSESEAIVPEALAVQLCDRRRGVGGDGVLLVLPPRDGSARARMRVINADGSVPEMCGNGLRCVALHLARRDRTLGPVELIVDTDAGPKTCVVTCSTDHEGEVSIAMGAVRVTGTREVTALGRSFTLTTADAGNPHAVFMGSFDRADVERYGPALATDPSFVRGTNVEFVRRRSPTHAEVIVWERGCGITLACGTGACATAVVLTNAGLAPYDKELTIELLGGPLHIRVDANEQVQMRGPARFVFDGSVAA